MTFDLLSLFHIEAWQLAELWAVYLMRVLNWDITSEKCFWKLHKENIKRKYLNCSQAQQHQYICYPAGPSDFSTGNPETWREEENCEYTSVFTRISHQTPQIITGSNPCVIAVATPETIWIASTRAKTRLWWTSSSRSTGRPNRRSSRSLGRKRTNMWWRQMQIWMPSWRSGGLWERWGL